MKIQKQKENKINGCEKTTESGSEWTTTKQSSAPPT